MAAQLECYLAVVKNLLKGFENDSSTVEAKATIQHYEQLAFKAVPPNDSTNLLEAIRGGEVNEEAALTLYSH